MLIFKADLRDLVHVASGWVYVEDASGEVPGCRLHFFMNEDTETDYYTEIAYSNITYSKDKWVYLEGKATVPPNIDKINLRVTLHGGGGAAAA
ncbi:hypothetical protein [Robertkochia solimangrovi]|uniref:hypothetical protein n=1 Tax=Robertkochia solimangrovi TaxID=2213046 RepID=UPI00117C9497|nr:hypothetical protein [Robertkochia solimangrovi]TRZ41660.1 hypothetical protein DMZ48_16765 [Robertkochia solimangrovi]